MRKLLRDLAGTPLLKTFDADWFVVCVILVYPTVRPTHITTTISSLRSRPFTSASGNVRRGQVFLGKKSMAGWCKGEKPLVSRNKNCNLGKELGFSKNIWFWVKDLCNPLSPWLFTSMSNSSCWDVHPSFSGTSGNEPHSNGHGTYYTKWPQSTTMKLSWSLLTGRWSQKGRTTPVGGSDLKNMLVKLMSQASGWKCKTLSPKKTPWWRTKETWNHWNLITHLSSLQLGPVASTQQYVECGEKLWFSEPQMNLSLKSYNTCGAAGVIAIQGWLLKDPNILRWVGGRTGFDSERNTTPKYYQIPMPY